MWTSTANKLKHIFKNRLKFQLILVVDFFFLKASAICLWVAISAVAFVLCIQHMFIVVIHRDNNL